MGLRDKLMKQAMEVSQKAMEMILADETRAMKIASAMGKVQRGREALTRQQENLMHALSFASKGDFKGVSKKLASLKRRMREVEEKVDALGEKHEG